MVGGIFGQGTLPRRPSHSPLIPEQALDGLDPSCAAARKCLCELRNIYGQNKAILPTSYTLPSDLLKIESDPFASGGYGDVYHGTLNGSRVCVKRVRMYTRDGPHKATKVCYGRRRFPRLPSLTKLTGLLPRGHNLETPETPEYLTAPRRHYHSPPTGFGLDAWRRPVGIHRNAP